MTNSSPNNSNQKERQKDLDRVQTQTRKERRKEADRLWRKNPIGAYEDENAYLTEKDLKNRLRVIRQFESHLVNRIAEQYDGEGEILGVRDAVEEDVESFLEEKLKSNQNISNSTIAGRLAYLNSFFDELESKNAIAGNPARDPLSDFRANHDLEPDRPYIPFERMQTFLHWLDYPFSRVAWLLALKQALRKGEALNIDLRCLNIKHPVFNAVIDEHEVRLDPRVRDKPDTILIYSGFNEGEEIPNDDTPGFEGDGEVRECGNKRKQDRGSVIPVDSELKTAIIEYLLVRPSTLHLDVHPLLVTGGSNNVNRIGESGTALRLWQRDGYSDSIQNFQEEERLEACPDCGGSVVEENPAFGERTGRRFRCRTCNGTHWRSIYWNTGLATEQRVTYHQGRHYFSSAHTPENSSLHEEYIPDKVRKKAIRGDSNQTGDTEDQVYIEDQYKDFETDVREPYLDGIYKFGLYEEIIPAVGEGWNQ